MDLADFEANARKAILSAAKVAYLNGNKAENDYGHAYARYVAENNKDLTRPALMLPKKKYRRG